MKLQILYFLFFLFLSSCSHQDVNNHQEENFKRNPAAVSSSCQDILKEIYKSSGKNSFRQLRKDVWKKTESYTGNKKFYIRYLLDSVHFIDYSHQVKELEKIRLKIESIEQKNIPFIYKE